LFSDKPAQNAAQAQIDSIKYGYSNLASPLYEAGRGALTENFGKAGDVYSGLRTGTQAGSDAYGDATGANGPEGLARARALFTSTPGYTEGINMALDQNDRRAASRGMLGSGNTIADTTKLAGDYASQKYGQYTNALQPYLGANAGAAAGQAGVYQGLGTGLNASDMSQGQLGFNAAAGIGNAQAQAELAKYQTSGNFINALLGAAKLGTGTIGGQALSGLGNIFGGGGGSVSGGPSANTLNTLAMSGSYGPGF
jgi:hypothetical protein